MCSSSSEAVVQMGKLVVHIAESGRSYKLDCDESTLVEAVQKFLESDCGIPFHDQLLLCLDLKLEPQRPLSAYKLPSNEREVFLFNKARMRNNSPHPAPEQVAIVDIPDLPLPSSSNCPHPLDDASDPALKALPSYERQFRFHFHCGHAIYNRTLAKIEMCERLFQEQKVQERALEIARGNLDHFYKMIHQNYTDFMKCYLQQHRSHANLLLNFGRDKEKLRSIRILPSLQTANRKCLLDFVKEENLQKTWEDCGISHRQFENKVSEFKLEFADLKRNTEQLFSGKASFLIKDLETSIEDHQRFINELKSIMQALSKDVNTVKKLVDDCLSDQMSSSLRPHDAVSALGPMYDSHEKDYLPKMQACESAISDLLNFCMEKKNEMNMFVHNYMQKIAYIQYSIKDVRYKFSVIQEALKRQNDQFEQLKVVRGIGPAYRACLAEVVRRKAAMKIYLGKAGQLAEKLATERGAEVRRREEFFKEHGTYIPRDILTSMGLYDMPNPCDVNIIPFDCNLLDIDISDLDRYAPESLLGLCSKSEKRGTLRSSSRMSDDSSEAAEVEAVDFPGKYDFHDLVEGSELVEISVTSKMEVENAKLKAELASKIALICSMSAEFDYGSLDDRKLDSIVQNVAEKTSEALHLKDVYEKHLQSMLKEKQMQCESYEKRIQELELRLSDQYVQGCKLSADQDASNFVASTTKNHDNKSEVSEVGEIPMHHAMDVVSCASSSKSGILPEHVKGQEGLDDNMTDSSGMLNPQLDSSMLDLNRDKGHLSGKEKKQILLCDGSTALATSNMAVSVSQKPDVLSCETAVLPGLDAKVSDNLVLELQQALAEKSSQLDNAKAKIQALIDEVYELGSELEINRKLLDESQMNCAHLENFLHEAREEAQTHLCAADRRASEYSALRASTVKMHGLFERLRSCVSSSGVAAFSDSLHALASSANENDDDSTAEFCEFVRILADKVAILSRQRAELLDRYSKAEATSEQLKKELEEKKELVNTLYLKHQLEKQANKEKISYGRLEVHEIAAFVLNSSGHYEAINRNCPYYYLSAESVALFADHLHTRPSYIVGQVVHIEHQIVKSSLSTSDQDHVDILTSETGTSQLTLNPGSTSNPYGLPIGREYFVVTVAMLPDTTVHSPPS
ncbi:autophagy-related protein 11 [Sesamum indicum]|uniref:Autophagy-related protein 11 n=1 Tax=Sesamum indicum TaxID=4182 RepID=A0A6I9TF58_SESIN|nr:autophagy-related protein 11 [Sesamum indicum]XP_020549580.1 autophagy-related protein 11 [Sesamum indicum]XP_020549581.1 autophagy-related protein 11 [Sesamum indicum]